MDVCNLEKTEVILGMLWLQVHNPEINWETGEVKMMRCLPERNSAVKENIEQRKKIEKRQIEMNGNRQWKKNLTRRLN